MYSPFLEKDTFLTTCSCPMKPKVFFYALLSGLVLCWRFMTSLLQDHEDMDALPPSLHDTV